MVNENHGAIQMPNGGWQPVECFCDNQPKGSGLRYINIKDDELNTIELGVRVTNYIQEKECVGWDALMDLIYEEDNKIKGEIE